MLNLIVLTTEVSSSRKHFKWKIFNSQYFETTDLENFDIQYIDQKKEKKKKRVNTELHLLYIYFLTPMPLWYP